MVAPSAQLRRQLNRAINDCNKSEIGRRREMATADSLTKIKLSVWREFVPSRTLLFRQEGAQPRQVLAGEPDLQQEVYAWHMREDPFGGVSDEGARTRLRE